MRLQLVEAGHLDGDGEDDADAGGGGGDAPDAAGSPMAAEPMRVHRALALGGRGEPPRGRGDGRRGAGHRQRRAGRPSASSSARTTRSRSTAAPVRGAEPLRAYLLHKARGVVSTASDPQGRPTVLDELPDDVRLYPVGRLDIDTTGALIVTNDGELAAG